MPKRGVIENRGRKRQICDFSGLLYGRNITPTDIDGFVDFGNKIFVWFEIKYLDTQMTAGQRTALERQCDASAKAGIVSFVIFARHEVADVNVDVDAAVCAVVSYYHGGRWLAPTKQHDIKSFINAILTKFGRESLIVRQPDGAEICVVCGEPIEKDHACWFWEGMNAGWRT